MIHQGTSPSYAGDDHQAVVLLDGGGHLLQMADVIAVQVEVDEWAQFILSIEQVLAQVRVLFDQTIHGVCNGFTFHLNHSLSIGICP